MNAIWIVTIFENIHTTIAHLDLHSLTKVPDSEVLTVAFVAAKYFQNYHAGALAVLQTLSHRSGPHNTSRFNRHLHALADSLCFRSETLVEVVTTGGVFVIDSLPLPVCRCVRVHRYRKMRGRVYCGFCAAKDEKFFGWRLHLICTSAGVLVH